MIKRPSCGAALSLNTFSHLRAANRKMLYISHATAALRQSTVEDIAFLISEEKLFKAAAAKFKELPGKDGPEPTPS